jgi:DNA polymerase I-like protein with 3'-5' exonuclease and polymerase domains
MSTKRYRADVKKQIANKGYAITMTNKKPKKPTLAQTARQGRAKVLDDQERKALNMAPKKAASKKKPAGKKSRKK